MNETIGYLRIGFKGDTKQLEKDLRSVERELEKYDKEKEKLANKSLTKQQELAELQKEINSYDKLNEKARKLEERLINLNNEKNKLTSEGYSVFDSEMKQNFALTEKTKAQLQEINLQLSKQENSHEKIVSKYEKAKKELTQIRSKIVEIEDNQKNLNEEAEEYKNQLKHSNLDFSQLSKSATKGFNSMIKGAKKLAFAIIGIRTGYALFRKALSSAMATDDKYQKQVEANWVGLGALLEPIVKWITEIIKKAVTGILYFFSLMSGGKVDYIKKANEMIIKNQQKQKKTTDELRKSTEKFSASFDELNMVQDNATQNSISDTLDTSVLFNVKDLSQGTIKAIQDIAKALQPIYEKIKEIINWGIKHPDVIIGILGGVALLNLLSKIIGVSNVSGLLGIIGLLTTIAAIGTIVIGIKLIDESIEGYNDVKDSIYKHQAQRANAVFDEQEETRKSTKNYKKNSKEVNNLTKSLNKNIDVEKNFQEATINQMKNMSDSEQLMKKYTGEWDVLQENILTSMKVEWEYLDTQQTLYKQGKLNTEQIQDYKTRLASYNERVNYLKTDTEKFTGIFKLQNEEMERLNILVRNSDDAMDSARLTTGLYTKTIEAEKKAVENLNKTFKEIPRELDTEIEVNAQEVKEKVDEMMKHIKGATSKKQSVTIDLTSKDFQDKLKNIKEKITEVVNKNYVVKVGILTAGEMFGIDSSTMNSLLKKLFPNAKGMATGGIHIVNNPGRGVVSGNVKRGESGAEGIIPLTEESALSELGASIGKHVVIYTTMINQINGRTLSKEVKEIMAQSNFASNG